MALHCVRCEAKVPAGFVDLDRVICQCKECGSVFDFEDQVAKDEAHPFARQRLPIPRPAGVSVHDAADRLVIVVPWMSPALWWRLVSGAVFGLFVVGTLLNVIGSTPLGRFALIWFIALCPVGVGLLGGLYIALTHFLNQTRIEVDATRLRVRSGPLPWEPPVDLPVARLDQLYCSARPLLGLFQRNEYCQHQTYCLRARLEDGSSLPLLRGMVDPDHVWFVEQRVESWLGIVDRHVRGEFR